MKKFLTLFVLIFVIVAKSNAQFVIGGSYLGPNVWLLNSLTIFGADYEYGLAKLGPGKFGIGANLDYYSTDYASIIWVGVTGLYHFDVNNQIDPFVGLNLYNSTVSYKDNFSTGGTSGIAWDIYGGARYFFTPSLAGNLTASFRGGINLRVGVDFKL